MRLFDPVYGEQEITDSVALDVMATKEMQRLKGINQYGISNLLDHKYFTSRYEHCVGVYLLLRKLGASQEEQIAGLVHDIAHTAFSHVIDYVFYEDATQNVHERFHKQVIFNSDIPSILQRQGLDVERIVEEHNYGLLERDLPALCADRVDYFLRDSRVFGISSTEEVKRWVGSLDTTEGEIVFTNIQSALQVSGKFMEMCLNVWSGSLNVGAYAYMASILREAVRREVICEGDFFLTDTELLGKLYGSGDSEIVRKLGLLSEKHIVEGTLEDHTFYTKGKARYINPKIVTTHGVFYATDVAPALEQEFAKLREKFERGIYIKILE